jgi:nucleotide-binding universal stress UspA family protein
MLRTFLIANRDLNPPSELEAVVRRLTELYRARLIVAEIRDAEELSRAVPAGAADERISPGAPQEADGSPPRSTSIMLVGSFVPAVCDKGHEADVIVVWDGSLAGGDGQTSAEILSSLVRQAPRPVWLFREPIRFPERILVAYDGSAHSGRALHMAANLAEVVGAHLTVLNVDESRDEVAQELILSRAVGYCEAYRITMERVGVFGAAAESIQAYTETSKCDLLVVGAAGVGYLRGLLFGSVAGQLIANAPCSVLVAK